MLKPKVPVRQVPGECKQWRQTTGMTAAPNYRREQNHRIPELFAMPPV